MAADEPDLAAEMDDYVGDDLLRLIFTTCHPVLSTESRVALTLRLLGGLSTDEIARAYLVSEATVGQRITRAKRTLADKRIAIELPPPAEAAARLASVLEVVYLIFNEGYAATAGDEDTQFASTVVGTERLLEAMARSSATRLLLVSSLVVYDWSRARRRMDEATPLAGDIYRMGAYDIAKHYDREILPLRQVISDEMLLNYNAMMKDVFSLVVDARARILANVQAIDAQRDFWLASVDLQTAIVGGGKGSVETVETPRPTPGAAEPAGH